MGKFHITRFAGPPTEAPSKSGYHWVDTNSNIHYLSVGTSSVNDWINSASPAVNHTGDVTGTTALTIDKSAIGGKTLVVAAVGDHVLVGDLSDEDKLKRVTIQTIIDLASGGGGTDDITISSAIPKIEVKDSGAEVPTRVVGRISADLTNTVDGSEDLDWLFEAIKNGSMKTFMKYDASADQLIIPVPMVIASSGPNGPSLMFDADSNLDTGWGATNNTLKGYAAGVSYLTISNSSVNCSIKFKIISGSKSSPGWQFASDGDLGAYRIAANRMGFTAGGVLGLEVNSVNLDCLLPLKLAVMDDTARDALTPAKGWVIMNDTSGLPEFYSGTIWKEFDGTTA